MTASLSQVRTVGHATYAHGLHALRGEIAPFLGDAQRGHYAVKAAKELIIGQGDLPAGNSVLAGAFPFF